MRVPLKAALDGSMDVIEYLQAMPEARIRAMQSMLGAHAHTLLYGIGPYSGDAIETMLSALHAGLSRPARARR